MSSELHAGHRSFSCRVDELLASTLDLTGVLGVPRDSLGELIVLAGLGIVCLARIAAAWMCPGGVGRPTIVTFTLLAALLGGVGIGFDVVHEVTSDRLQWVLGTVEGGGEMIFAAAMLALAAQVAARSKSGIE